MFVMFAKPLRLLASVALAMTSVALGLVSGCHSETSDIVPQPQPQLAGTPGNPRFNLQFTNSANVDLDLYVKTPSGTIIYYGNKSAQGGRLDVDCLCTACPNGPNENIYWVPGTAPAGTYQFWVQYYGSCGSSTAPTSDYTLHVVNNNTVVSTYTGTLSQTLNKSAVYSKTY